MKLNYFPIIAFLILFFIGCEKDKKESVSLKEDNKTVVESQDAVLTQNYNRPFSLHFTNGNFLHMQKTNKGYDIENNKTATLFAFFATWCPPCKVEIPTLNNMQEKFKDKLNVIGILIEDKSLEEINSFIKNNNIKYNIAYGDENNFFAESLGGIIGMPYMILYHPDGTYATHYLGIVPEEMLANDLERILS